MNTETLVRSYVPAGFYLKDKQEDPCRECSEDFAMVSVEDNFRVVARRGTHFPIGVPIAESAGISASELGFLRDAMQKSLPCVLLSDRGILIFFPELLLSATVMPVLFPFGEASGIYRALLLLPERKFLFSDAVRALPTPHCKVDDLCRMLEEQLDYCDRILHPGTQNDFRMHASVIAYFCGCRTNILALPVGALPIPRSALIRWTAYLLCLFLSYWSDAPEGSEIRVREITHEEIGLSVTQPFRSVTAFRLPFTELPCFSDFHLSVKENRLTLEVSLPCESPVLRSGSARLWLTVSFETLPEF